MFFSDFLKRPWIAVICREWEKCTAALQAAWVGGSIYPGVPVKFSKKYSPVRVVRVLVYSSSFCQTFDFSKSASAVFLSRSLTSFTVHPIPTLVENEQSVTRERVNDVNRSSFGPGHARNPFLRATARVLNDGHLLSFSGFLPSDRTEPRFAPQKPKRI